MHNSKSQAGILPKWFSNQGIILAKWQLDHSYTFWSRSTLIFGTVQIIMGHPLTAYKKCLEKLTLKKKKMLKADAEVFST